MSTYSETREEIEVIRTETAKNANSAERVGTAMGHIADRILKNAQQITLLASGWSGSTYAYALDGITADSVVFASADPETDANFNAYNSAGIRGTTTAEGIINFKAANSVPAVDINVLIAVF